MNPALHKLLLKIDSDQAAFVREVCNGTGNLRIVAAAGSGKTTSMIAANGAALTVGGYLPHEIVDTTFTSKAGKELRQRLVEVLGEPVVEQMRVGTFHGLALRAMRDVNPNQWDMSRCVDANGRTRAAQIPTSLDLWSQVCGWDKVRHTSLSGLDLSLTDKGLTSMDYAAQAGLMRSFGLDAFLSETHPEFKLRLERMKPLPDFLRAWRHYRQAMQELCAWDFDDVLQAWRDLLQASVYGAGTGRGPLVFVDEAQDNSKVQLELAALLARGGRLVLVGDGRQAIYSFRGAFAEFFQDAEKLIGATTLYLPRNYRSLPAIVNAGNRIAAAKPWSAGPPAVAARSGASNIYIEGEHADPAVEAAWVAQDIQSQLDAGERPESFAVLARTNSLVGAVAAACVTAGVPCVVVGATPLFQRRDVLEYIAYVALAMSDQAFPALERVINRPKRYLSKAFAQAVAQQGGPLPDAILAAGRASGKPHILRSASEFSRWLRQLRSSPWPKQAEMIGRLLSGTLHDNGSVDADDRLGIFATVTRLAVAQPSAADFIAFAQKCESSIGTADDDRATRGRVCLLTVHRSKGLEWPNLYLLGLTKGTFPHARSTSPDELEEELRLLYVGVTRARNSLTATWSHLDGKGKPAGESPFVSYLR